MISVKCTVNVQYILENNQSTILVIFNQIKCESNKLSQKSILEKYISKLRTQLSKHFQEKE